MLPHRSQGNERPAGRQASTVQEPGQVCTTPLMVASSVRSHNFSRRVVQCAMHSWSRPGGGGKSVANDAQKNRARREWVLPFAPPGTDRGLTGPGRRSSSSRRGKRHSGAWGATLAHPLPAEQVPHQGSSPKLRLTVSQLPTIGNCAAGLAQGSKKEGQVTGLLNAQSSSFCCSTACTPTFGLGHKLGSATMTFFKYNASSPTLPTLND